MFVGLQIIQIDVLCVLIVIICKQYIIEQIIDAICEVDIIYEFLYYGLFCKFQCSENLEGHTEST